MLITTIWKGSIMRMSGGFLRRSGRGSAYLEYTIAAIGMALATLGVAAWLKASNGGGGGAAGAALGDQLNTIAGPVTF